MRTTLSLDDDVALRLERRRLETGASLESIVGAVLRAGLDAVEQAAPKARVVLPAIDLGGYRLANVDDVATALATAEAELRR